MRDRTWIRRIVVGAGIAFVVAVAGAFVAVRLLGGDAPAEARLTLDPSTSGSTAPGGSTVGSAGDWTLYTTSGSLADGTATYAGYRIQEELGGIGANTAVGRTQQVSGSMSISGRAITDLVVTVDMTTLTSDEDRRDMSLRDRGLETSTFPQASFTLTEPIVLDHRPAVGETIKLSATGDLLLHGVTRSVTVPVEARRTDSEIEVVASFDVTLADYDIEAPVGFAVLSVADTGTVEMHLLFARS